MTLEPQPRISVVIVSWNREEDLARLLRDLLAQRDPADEVIVIDNGSTDGSRHTIESQYPWVRLVTLPANAGLSAGRNAGIAVARFDWVSILDNDLRLLDRDFWTKARASIREHPDCDAITFHLFEGRREPCGASEPRVVTMSALEAMAAEGVAPVEAASYYEWFLWGGCCLISKRALSLVGGFDPFFGYGGEEWDFAYRCHAAGLRLLRDTRLWAVHSRSPEMRSPRAPALILQNMVIAQARYMPGSDLAVFLVAQLAVSLVRAARSCQLRSLLQMILEIRRLWRDQVRGHRRTVSRALMRRFYFLRSHRTGDFRQVEDAHLSALGFYWRRLRRRTPEQRAILPGVVLLDR